MEYVRETPAVGRSTINSDEQLLEQMKPGGTEMIRGVMTPL